MVEMHVLRASADWVCEPLSGRAFHRGGNRSTSVRLGGPEGDCLVVYRSWHRDDLRSPAAPPRSSICAAHGVRSRRRDLIVPVSALSVALLAVLHSLVDFSLQIPGYSIPALALVGAGLAQSFVSVRRRTNSDPANSHLTHDLVRQDGVIAVSRSG